MPLSILFPLPAIQSSKSSISTYHLFVCHSSLFHSLALSLLANRGWRGEVIFHIDKIVTELEDSNPSLMTPNTVVLVFISEGKECESSVHNISSLLSPIASNITNAENF